MGANLYKAKQYFATAYTEGLLDSYSPEHPTGFVLIDGYTFTYTLTSKYLSVRKGKEHVLDFFDGRPKWATFSSGFDHRENVEKALEEFGLRIDSYTQEKEKSVRTIVST